MIWFIIIVIVMTLWFYGRSYQKKRLRQQNYLRDYIFPMALDRKLRERYPNLNNEQIALVFRALYDYFRICQFAKGKMVAMPSQVVDDVWHDFILFTRLYQLFCQQALGRFLHHTPTEAMNSPTLANQGIKRAWRLSCHLENIDAKAPEKLPLLFAIDGLLDIENGFKYDLNCQANSGNYCASDIGCSSGCSGDSGGCSGDSSDSSGDSGCGGGCGGGGD